MLEASDWQQKRFFGHVLLPVVRNNMQRLFGPPPGAKSLRLALRQNLIGAGIIVVKHAGKVEHVLHVILCSLGREIFALVLLSHGCRAPRDQAVGNREADQEQGDQIPAAGY